MVLSINYLYWLAEIILTTTALMIFADKNHLRRWTTGLLWVIFAITFLVGDKIPPIVVGAGAVVMTLLAGTGGVTLDKHGELPTEERRASAKRLGNRLLIPALITPLAAVIDSVFLKDVKIGGDLLLDLKNQAFVLLGLGCIISLTLACWLTRDTLAQAMCESHRLTESFGWALVLPQMLTMFGLVFVDAGVGRAVVHLTATYISMDYRLVAVAVYRVGMALSAVTVGNGLAAFPVMAGGVGVPILVGVFYANPVVMAAIGMFSGYRDTLMTPTAMNFNIVPATLLELSDKNAVVKAQVPAALLLPAANIVLLYFLMFH